jgi:stringent starvation protein B
MLSNKPYLIRAFYEWIVDSRCTPLLVVNATVPRCNVPQEYIENGEIILNISPDAIRDFKVSRNIIEFKASFSGIAHLISAPIRAVLAIYAEENGQGMFFDMEDEEEGSDDWVEEPSMLQQQGESHPGTVQPEKRKSHLTLVE